MSDTADTPDWTEQPEMVERRVVYRAALANPEWAVHELLTVALGTLRVLTVQYTPAQMSARATEAVATIDRLVAEKLAEQAVPDAG